MTAEAKTILVVEDDIDALEILAWLLESAGYEVLPARDGNEALRALRNRKVDLILLDMRMPEMDGWQFRDLQRRDPQMAAVPVVVLTGDRRAAEDHEMSRAAACLRKPIDAASLLPLVAQCARARAAP